MRLSERLLLSVCRPIDAEPLPVGTTTYSLDNALDYAKRMIPDFPERLRGKTVLDYGCGPGWQSVAMRKAGAESVHGIDINEEWLQEARNRAEEARVREGIAFGQQPIHDKYDVVISLNSMEHFRDPALELQRMCSLAREEVIVSFCEPWYSPYGTHMNGTTRLPWLNLLFSERTLMNVRNLYPDGEDGATRFEDIRGGLNKMTVARFERLVRSAPGMRVAYLGHRAVKGVPLVTHLPVVRELLTSSCTCILTSATRG